jgi:thioredoxin 1
MNYSIVFALGIGLLISLYFAKIYLSRYKLIGEPNPLRNVHQEGDADWQLYYFHSPRCGACKNITPWVGEQQKILPNVISVDISKDSDTAIKFHIRATPTAVFVENNVVMDVLLGTSISQPMKDFVASQDTTNQTPSN